MQQKRSIGFGFRGWILIIFQGMSFMICTAFTNYPQNVLSGSYGGTTTLTAVFTTGSLLGVLVMFILSRRIRYIKNMKRLSLIFAFASLLVALGIIFVPPTMLALWLVCLGIESCVSLVWCQWATGILVGQWFPRRKGTVMGVSTIMYPISGGILLNVFAINYSDYLATHPNIALFLAFLPFWVVGLVASILAAILIKDYPEECGCFRDNDKSMTAEMANAMMAEEIKNRETSVWTPKNVFKLRDFWFITISEGFMVFSAVGMMVQIIPVLAGYNEELKALAIPSFKLMSMGFSSVLVGVSIFSAFGSWLLGVIDTKYGTKTCVTIIGVIMTIAGICGAIHSLPTILIAAACLAVFMGAQSNTQVSAAARYWRREDFPSVYAVLSPITAGMNALGPLLIALIASTLNYQYSFGFIAILGVISLVLIRLFNPAHIVEVDDKLRAAAGKPLDGALEARLHKEGMESSAY